MLADGSVFVYSEEAAAANRKGIRSSAKLEGFYGFGVVNKGFANKSWQCRAMFYG